MNLKQRKNCLIVKKAVDKQISLFMTWINLGEVYYRVWHEYGEIKALKVLETIKNWPVLLLPGDEDLTLKAAQIKANNSLSYADAYAIAAALKYVFSHLPIVIVERKFYL
jgi:predicted nucleic acid-binding protein